MLKINVMRLPSVELDGAPVAFPFKRADALLYYMAVQKSATRQELVSLLWEDYQRLKAAAQHSVSLKEDTGRRFSDLAPEIADPRQSGLGAGL